MTSTPARQDRFFGLRILSLLSSCTPFRSPTHFARWRRALPWSLVISGTALLAACGGGGGGGSEPPGPTVTITISGTATYDFVPTQPDGTGLNYNAITQKPIRGARVDLLNIHDLLLATAVTDSQGAYSLSTNRLREGMKIRVYAELLDNTSPGTYAVTVRDNTASNALYVLDSDYFSPTADETRNVRAGSGWGGSSYTGTRAAAPFAVLDVAYQAIQKVLSSAPSASLPTLRMYWSKNNIPSSGSLAQGLIGTSHFRYSDSNYSMYLLGQENGDTDEYDTHVVAHEFGHYLQQALSTDDSVGGMHTGGDLLDMRVAFSEGWGNAWAGIVMNDPVYTDSSGSQQTTGFKLDVSAAPTNTTNNVVGFFSESTAQYLIWSLNANNAIGFTPIYNALVALKNSPQFTSLYSFGMAVKNAGANATTVNNLWSAQSIVLSDAYGTGETNFGVSTWAGQITAASPIYRDYSVGTTHQYCLDNSANNYDYFGNKLGNSKFVKFTVPSTGLYDLTLAPTGGLTGTAPHFDVVTSTGTRLQSVDVVGAELAKINLVRLRGGETNVAALTDYKMAFDDTLPRCFNFAVYFYSN